MSRAHAVASKVGTRPPFREPARGLILPATSPIGGYETPDASFYLERAMLLWPRLDRARLSRLADDPARIAQMVQERTSQPHAAILAMLTRESSAQRAPMLDETGPDPTRLDPVLTALRIVPS
jgi:hypothetical protein